VFFLWLAGVPPALGLAVSCPFEEDPNTIKTVPYQNLYGWVDSIPKQKGEFEKTAAFDRRRQNALTSVREILKLKTGSDWIIARKSIAKAHYDADREAVLITTEDRYSARVTTDYIYDIVVLDDFIADHKAFGLEVGNYTTELGQYDAQNAFGVHARITKQLTFRDTVAFGDQDNMVVPHFPPILAIRVPPLKAKS
jgi:hypothetical protein